MCDCCKAEGRDFQFRTGARSKVKHAKLYRIYVGRVKDIKLCRLCDIELFHNGESRFLENNIQYAQALSAGEF